MCLVDLNDVVNGVLLWVLVYVDVNNFECVGVVGLVYWFVDGQDDEVVVLYDIVCDQQFFGLMQCFVVVGVVGQWQ